MRGPSEGLGGRGGKFKVQGSGTRGGARSTETGQGLGAFGEVVEAGAEEGAGLGEGGFDGFAEAVEGGGGFLDFGLAVGEEGGEGVPGGDGVVEADEGDFGGGLGVLIVVEVIAAGGAAEFDVDEVLVPADDVDGVAEAGDVGDGVGIGEAELGGFGEGESFEVEGVASAVEPAVDEGDVFFGGAAVGGVGRGGDGGFGADLFADFVEVDAFFLELFFEHLEAEFEYFGGVFDGGFHGGVAAFADAGGFGGGVDGAAFGEAAAFAPAVAVVEDAGDEVGVVDDVFEFIGGHVGAS